MKLNDALWEAQITPKISMANSPYLLVYGKEVVLPVHLHINSLMVAFDVEYNEASPVQARLCQLFQLEEHREKVLASIQKRKQLSKINLFFSRINIERSLPCTQSLKIYGLALTKLRKS